MKTILGNTNLFINLKHLDSYCMKENIGIVLDSNHLQDLITSKDIQRCADNNWQQHNHYYFIINNHLTKQMVHLIESGANSKFITGIICSKNNQKEMLMSLQKYCSSVHLSFYILTDNTKNINEGQMTMSMEELYDF